MTRTCSTDGEARFSVAVGPTAWFPKDCMAYSEKKKIGCVLVLGAAALAGCEEVGAPSDDGGMVSPDGSGGQTAATGGTGGVVGFVPAAGGGIDCNVFRCAVAGASPGGAGGEGGDAP